MTPWAQVKYPLEMMYRQTKMIDLCCVQSLLLHYLIFLVSLIWALALPQVSFPKSQIFDPQFEPKTIRVRRQCCFAWWWTCWASCSTSSPSPSTSPGLPSLGECNKLCIINVIRISKCLGGLERSPRSSAQEWPSSTCWQGIASTFKLHSRLCWPFLYL